MRDAPLQTRALRPFFMPAWNSPRVRVTNVSSITHMHTGALRGVARLHGRHGQKRLPYGPLEGICSILHPTFGECPLHALG